MIDQPRSRTLHLTTGLRSHVLEWGGDRPGLDHTVVLLHGFLDLAWGWEATAAAGLAGRFHLVAPDMRGHGDSDRVGAGGYYHFMDYLADLHDVVAQLGRGRVSLVGHSMGGSIASYFAGTYPARIHRLAVLEGTGPLETTTPVPDRVAAWIAAWERIARTPPRRYASVEDAAARLRQHDALLEPTLALELARHGTIADGDGVRFKHDPLHATMGPYPFKLDVAESFWRRVTCPVLLVDGARSTLRHAADEAARRHACFTDRRHATIDGAGHMMQRHRPAELAAVLSLFLSP